VTHVLLRLNKAEVRHLGRLLIDNEEAGDYHGDPDYYWHIHEQLLKLMDHAVESFEKGRAE